MADIIRLNGLWQQPLCWYRIKDGLLPFSGDILPVSGLRDHVVILALWLVVLLMEDTRKSPICRLQPPLGCLEGTNRRNSVLDRSSELGHSLSYLVGII